MAFTTRSVLLSLFGGILLGAFLLNGFALFASLETTFKLFTTLLMEPWVLKTLAFAVMVGSVMALMERSGGIEGFVDFMQHRALLVRSQRSALMLSYIVGIFIFIESNLSSLIAGAVGRPFCRQYKIPSAKLALVCDSTSAPVSSLVILNGWGALLLGLITTQISLNALNLDAMDILLGSIVYNFYAMAALLVTFVVIWFGVDIGPMKNAKHKPLEQEGVTQNVASMFLMLLPIFLMIFLVFLFLYITGGGDILKGSGSSAIFYTMLSALLFTLLYYVGSKNMSLLTWSKTAFEGAIKIVPIVFILLFAFAIGEMTTQLKTGHYLASLVSQNLSVVFLAALIFTIASLISLATGTSWGTFSIMIPIAIPMALSMDANIALCVGAAISGGVFGDHCSPISDTTIISAMASDCELMEHTKTQFPYALVSWGIAFAFFVLFGLIS